MPVPSLAHLLPHHSHHPTPNTTTPYRIAPLGPGYHCLRFRPHPLNPQGGPPVCVEKAYPPASHDDDSSFPSLLGEPPQPAPMAVARGRRRGQGLEEAEEEGDGVVVVGGVTLLLLARADAWGADATAARRLERARVAEAVAAWGGEVVVVEYRVGAGEGTEEAWEGEGGVRVLPFVVADGVVEDR